MIGKALKVDMNTLAQGGKNARLVERGKFARVSVEIDLNKKLQSRFVLRRKIFTVEYEGLDAICFLCGKYGHKENDCPDKPKPSQPSAPQGTSPPSLGAEVGSSTEIRPPPVSPQPESPALDRQPLFSTPGVDPEVEFGEWMKVKPSVRKPSLKGGTAKKGAAAES